MSESCWILLNILLKYYYQYAYRTYEAFTACEDEKIILRQLTELNQLLKNKNDGEKLQYALVLDGMNELSSELQKSLAEELNVFSKFRQLEVCGIPDSEIEGAVSGVPDYEAVDRAYSTYILNEKIYQSYTSQKGILKDVLPEISGKNDFIEFILDNCYFLTVSESNLQKIYFTNQHFRDYFAARHILNVLEALDISYGKNHTDEKLEIFKNLKMDKVWYDSDYANEVYRLIGEISGDYMNIPDEEGDMDYHETILDKLIDMTREFEQFDTLQNVIKVMGIVRNGVICDVQFQYTTLPGYIPCNIKFSLDGELESVFWKCKVQSIEIAAQKTDCAAYPPDGKFLLLVLPDGYVVLWDIQQKKLVRDYDVSQYAQGGTDFEIAVFSPDGKYVSPLSSNSVLLLKLDTGSVVFSYSEIGLVLLVCDYAAFSSDSKYWLASLSDGEHLVSLETCREIHMDSPKEHYGSFSHVVFDLTGDEDNRLTPEQMKSVNNLLNTDIRSQFNHFKNCHFFYSDFDNDREFLRLTGAIVD